jgi:hypothetical protein
MSRGIAFLELPVAVFPVADDRVAQAVEVDADLVAAARGRPGQDEGVAGESLGDLVVRDRRLAPLLVDAHPARAELADGAVDAAAVLGDLAEDEDDVGLADGPAVELPVEVAVGGGVAGEDDDPAGFPVEAVDGEELARVDVREELGQSAAAGLRDRQDALGLVDGQIVVVLIEDPDRGRRHFSALNGFPSRRLRAITRSSAVSGMRSG